MDFNHIYTVPMLGTHKAVDVTPRPGGLFARDLRRSREEIDMDNYINLCLGILLILFGTGVVPFTYDKVKNEEHRKKVGLFVILIGTFFILSSIYKML